MQLKVSSKPIRFRAGDFFGAWKAPPKKKQYEGKNVNLKIWQNFKGKKKQPKTHRIARMSFWPGFVSINGDRISGSSFTYLNLWGY